MGTRRYHNGPVEYADFDALDVRLLRVKAGGEVFYEDVVGGPLTLARKNVPVLTAGSPAELTTIAVPRSFTRYHLMGLSTVPTNLLVAETAVGTLAGARFQIWTTQDESGVQLNTIDIVGPSAAGGVVAWASLNTLLHTTNTLYIKQTVDSANAGTVSFFITVWPLP